MGGCLAIFRVELYKSLLSVSGQYRFMANPEASIDDFFTLTAFAAAW